MFSGAARVFAILLRRLLMSLASSLDRGAPEEELEAPLDAGSAAPDLLDVPAVSDFELASGFEDLLCSGVGAAAGEGFGSGGGGGLGGGFNSGFSFTALLLVSSLSAFSLGDFLPKS